MIYPYRCDCGKEFKVAKSSKIIDRVEVCPDCGHNCTKANRYLSRGSFYGAAVEDAEYNPAFGKVIRNGKHRAAEAKARGMEEVGNSDLTAYYNSVDKDKEKARDASYEAAAQEAGEFLDG